jgi:hypothetical protein
MTFSYLLLGHLIGDFALQTDKMAENKGRQWKWTLFHSIAVTLCILVFSFPYGLLLNGLVLLNGAAHFLLDHYKAEIRRRLHLSELSSFLADQLTHVLLLFAVSLAAADGHSPISAEAVRLLIVLVLVTSFSAVFTQFILAALFPRAEGRFFEDGEKPVGILTRLLLSIVLYISFFYSPYFLFLLLIVAVSYSLEYRFEWSKWMSLRHFAAKFLLDALVSAACFLLVLL